MILDNLKLTIIIAFLLHILLNIGTFSKSTYSSTALIYVSEPDEAIESCIWK